jgi:hypothetical protein
MAMEPESVGGEDETSTEQTFHDCPENEWLRATDAWIGDVATEQGSTGMTGDFANELLSIHEQLHDCQLLMGPGFGEGVEILPPNRVIRAPCSSINSTGQMNAYDESVCDFRPQISRLSHHFQGR